jgi:Cu-Zn family superoxide dismutase
MKTWATGAVALAAVFGPAAVPGPAAAGEFSGGVQVLRAQRLVAAVAPDGVSYDAVSYDAELVPPGTTVVVGQRVADGGMTIEVAAAGLVAGRTYGTHVHTGACGVDPAAAGPHYRHRPGAAGPENEVWLDFTTDARGAGRAEAAVGWVFRSGAARSVVLHERATSHGHDGHEPGDAGARVACFTVPFAGAGGS